jgi:serine/threonine protein kinase
MLVLTTDWRISKPKDHIPNINDTEMEEVKNSDSKIDHDLDKKWSNLSEDVRYLIVQMLSKEPFARPTIEEVLDHPWFYRPFTKETQ